MRLWNFFFGPNNHAPSATPAVNPSMGLPVIDNTFIDIGGETYGADNSWGSFSSDSWSGTSSLSDSGWAFDKAAYV